MAVNKYTRRIRYRFIALDINAFVTEKTNSIDFFICFCEKFVTDWHKIIFTIKLRKKITPKKSEKVQSLTSRKLEMLRLRLPRKIPSVPSYMDVYDKVYNCT